MFIRKKQKGWRKDKDNGRKKQMITLLRETETTREREREREREKERRK
jgi:hypothetical protein